MEKTYTNGEITIFWHPEKCKHSGKCVSGAPHVFRPGSRPWVYMDQDTTEEIIRVIDTCPSGALSYKKNADL